MSSHAQTSGALQTMAKTYVIVSSIRTGGCTAVWVKARNHHCWCRSCRAGQQEAVWKSRRYEILAGVQWHPGIASDNWEILLVVHFLIYGTIEAAVSGEIVLTWTLVLTALWPGDSEVQKWWVFVYCLPIANQNLSPPWGSSAEGGGFSPLRYLCPSLWPVQATNTDLERG